MRAMVIDDSRAIRFMLSNMLKEFGFETLEAAHGREALDKLRNLGKLDLALVDWNMPEMNGLEFIKAVRAEPGFRDTWLMMVTTETEMSQMVRALAAGANEYVMKPFTRDVIQDKLRIMGLMESQEQQ